VDYRQRVRTTVRCTDCDSIPKVDDAGQVVEQNEAGRPYQIMHNGIRVFTDSHYGDFNTEVIRQLRGHHEPQEEKVFYEVLKVIPPGAVMIELGSFWAYYSMWFSKSVENARNYMVEPMRHVMLHGMANFELNQLQGEFTQACVGKETRDQVQFQHWDGTLHEIPQVAVDDFVESEGLEHINILHADIQGAEYDMLVGARKSLNEGRIDFIFVSTHSELLHRQCLRFLLKIGMRIIAEHSPSESYAVDGLIVGCKQSVDLPDIQISRRKPSFSTFVGWLRYKLHLLRHRSVSGCRATGGGTRSNA
jgi:FkbM family methyltransferase